VPHHSQKRAKTESLGTARAKCGTTVPNFCTSFLDFSLFTHSSQKPLSILTQPLKLLTYKPSKPPSKLNQFTKFLHQINSKHHHNQNPPPKNNFHPPKPQIPKFEILQNLTQKPPNLHKNLPFNLKTLLQTQPHNKTYLFHKKNFPNPNLPHIHKKVNMTPKRLGKEVASSSDGGNKRQATPKNHDIKFRTPEQWSRYKSLLSKPLHPCRYPDDYDMNRLGIRDNVNVLLNRLGWGDMMRPMRGYENFTYEF